MADNVTLPGTGSSVAADDISGNLYQRVKIAVGADGEAADLDHGQAAMAASLPVVIASDQSAVTVADGGGSLTVDGPLTDAQLRATAVPVSVATVPSHAVTNAGTFAVQESGAALTALQLLDNCIAGSEAQVDVVTVPAPLSTTGSGTQATALRVTIATDTSGVLSVDDNDTTLSVDDGGGSLTVDVGTALPAGTNNIGDVDVLTVPAPLSTTGGGTEATALRVTVATDSTGVLSVDDNGGSLTVDGTVTVAGAAADDAAASGNPVPMGGMFQTSVDEVDAGDIGRLRMTARRAMLAGADCRVLEVSAAAPTPSGSDLFNISYGALASGDFDIRDTNTHDICIPLAIVGWRNLTVFLQNSSTAWDQTVVATVHVLSEPGAYKIAQVGSWNLGVTASLRMIFGSGGAAGQGGVVGGATAAAQAWYSIPALASAPYVLLSLRAPVAPTTGSLTVQIARSS